MQYSLTMATVLTFVSIGGLKRCCVLNTHNSCLMPPEIQGTIHPMVQLHYLLSKLLFSRLQTLFCLISFLSSTESARICLIILLCLCVLRNDLIFAVLLVINSQI